MGVGGGFYLIVHVSLIFCSYVGHLKERTLKEQMQRDSTEVIRKAVLRMLPRNKLRDVKCLLSSEVHLPSRNAYIDLRSKKPATYPLQAFLFLDVTNSQQEQIVVCFYRTVQENCESSMMRFTHFLFSHLTHTQCLHAKWGRCDPETGVLPFVHSKILPKIRKLLFWSNHCVQLKSSPYFQHFESWVGILECW